MVELVAMAAGGGEALAPVPAPAAADEAPRPRISERRGRAASTSCSASVNAADAGAAAPRPRFLAEPGATLRSSALASNTNASTSSFVALSPEPAALRAPLLPPLTASMSRRRCAPMLPKVR
jgi:hypothetical protein